MKKCPPSIQCWDWNSQPLEHESPPITTRPGLPPNYSQIVCVESFADNCVFYIQNVSVAQDDCVVRRCYPIHSHDSVGQT